MYWDWKYSNTVEEKKSLKCANILIILTSNSCLQLVNLLNKRANVQCTVCQSSALKLLELCWVSQYMVWICKCDVGLYTIQGTIGPVDNGKNTKLFAFYFIDKTEKNNTRKFVFLKKDLLRLKVLQHCWGK